MIKADGLDYVTRKFHDEEEAITAQWGNDTSGKRFKMLYEQLVDDHGLSPMAAVDILESAFLATADEFHA